MIVEKYTVTSQKISTEVSIEKVNDFVLHYNLKTQEIGRGTLGILNKIKTILLAEIPLKHGEITDFQKWEEMKNKVHQKAIEEIKKEIPTIDEKTALFLAGSLIQEMFGLGKLEFLLEDPNLEEIAINGSKQPVWVYHKKYGWLKTNVFVPTEIDIQNYANTIARRIGRQITLLNPLLDAHLPTGDRVNSTLFPISSFGNTITIRKFRRSPWSITELIKNNTISFEVASLIWLAIQYELNMIVAGGTGSGKTTLLNVFANFIPPNHRIVSIEDTRELNLSEFLHWVPLTTREPNPEGLGGIEMLDLLVNSLRMRPDRIIVGEIRRAREAEVLFEAMHTGHSVYATLHADTAEQAIKRLTNPPINVPESVLDALHLLTVAFRDRRTGKRRLLQVAEIIGGEKGVKVNVFYKWKPAKDIIEKIGDIYRIFEEIRSFTGMSDEEIMEDLAEKEKILRYFVKNDIVDLNKIGKIISIYYTNKEIVLNNLDKKIDEIIKKWES
ncbi:MAG: ATPase, T2SS/T4P/T4SS family [Candidatus Aenigmarchaeota archaeon]|nr:ATPase, T2SS/T4P/T4SS family [Candidatus Aenigmarchaeota archaeon]MDW8149019.1 ATPase, T2SS/T4P/T4SS family [Candidatus Aenigmarchaeota archaeon]